MGLDGNRLGNSAIVIRDRRPSLSKYDANALDRLFKRAI
ncbi:MAG: hypothetical protein JWQ23_3785 [Herminiimonas sp.]|nr:hypothetical protein [Herminiimonas sp.]